MADRPSESEVLAESGGRLRRVPPNHPDAEEGLLACCMLDTDNQVINFCLEARLVAKSFYKPHHQIIFQVMLDLYKKQQPIEETSVLDALQSWTVKDIPWLKESAKGISDQSSLLQIIEGPETIHRILDRIETISHAKHWLKIVRDKWILRRLITTTTRIAESAYVNQDQIPEFIDAVEKQILQINEDLAEETAQNFGQAVTVAHQMILSILDGKFESGVQTGYDDIDRMTFGLHSGQMIVLAARPSMGKTALAMNFAENVAIPRRLKDPAHGVLVFSLEMPADQLAMRMMCGRARVNMKRIREGVHNKEDMQRLVRVSKELSQAPIWVDDAMGMTILELRAKARRRVRTDPIRLIVIDYLQLLNGTDPRVPREQQIAEISRGIKGLAKELNIPVLVLSQLNRSADKENRPPRLSDLRESGSIEQDADVVFLLAPRAKGEDNLSIPQASRERNLIIAKQRNGPTGEVPLTFIPDFTRFESFTVEREN